MGQRFAALFGALNVGGNRIAMADLRTLADTLGLRAPATVLASGNLIFTAADDEGEAALADRLSQGICHSFGFDSFAVIRTCEALTSARDRNPFYGNGADRFVHTHFLRAPVAGADVAALIAANSGKERIAAGRREIYIDFVEGVASSKLTRPFLKKYLKADGTARNMSSLTKIIAKMD